MLPPIAEIVPALKITRAEFDRIFLQAQVELEVDPAKRVHFEAVTMKGPDADAFAEALQYAAARDWLEMIVYMIVRDGLADATLRQQILAGGAASDAGLEAMTNIAKGFGQPDLIYRGIADGMRWTVKVTVGGVFSGTGVLIGPNLVLTAWHVVKALFIIDAAGKWSPDPDGFKRLDVIFDDFLARASGGGVKSSAATKIGAHPNWCVKWSRCHDEELQDRIPADPAELAGFWDYAILRLRKTPGVERQWAPVSGTGIVPKTGSEVFLFQHPSGQPLKLDDGILVEPVPPAPNAVPGLRFLHKANARPGSSGGPCFDKTFTLFGLHQGAWPGDEINRGVPITQVCSDIESTGGLPAPEPSDLFVWKTLELEAPVIGCDAFQTLIWNSALSGTPQLIPIPASSAGGAGSGKSFRLTVLSEMLPAAGHLKIPLKASELGGAGGEADAMRVVAAICKTAGAPQPPITALADYNAPVDSWLKDEVVPKLIGALDSARVSRLVWISIEDLNKFKLEGAISNLLLFLYEQLTPIRWLRIVLDGMRGDIPKSLRQITANPAPAVEVISEADITDYLRRAMAEIKPPGADTLRLAVKGAKRIYDKARGNEPETAAGELVDWLRDTLRDYEGDVEGSQ